MTIPKLMTMAEVSGMIRIPVNTLRYWRYIGQGPKSGKFGSRVMYREQDVIDWINQAFEGDRGE